MKLLTVATLLASPVAGSSNKKSAWSTTRLLRAAAIASAATVGAAASNHGISNGALVTYPVVSPPADPTTGGQRSLVPGRQTLAFTATSFDAPGAFDSPGPLPAGVPRAEDLIQSMYCQDCTPFRFWHTPSYRGPPINRADLDALAEYPNLSLIIDKSRIDDYAVLRHLPRNLKSLTLRHTHIQDLSVLNGLEHLEYLHLDSTHVKSISEPLNLPNLKVLNLSGCDVEDISGLASLNSLVHLDLSGTDVKDVSPLAGLNNLETLDFSRSYDLENIDALASLKKLKVLVLRSTAVTNVDALSAVTTLQKLYVHGSPVKNFDKLKKIPNLLVSMDPPNRSAGFAWFKDGFLY